MSKERKRSWDGELSDDDLAEDNDAKKVRLRKKEAFILGFAVVCDTQLYGLKL